jgi:lysozyme
MMQLGTKGKALIQGFEKLALTAYQDQGGIWTIGWGHVNSGIRAGDKCSPEQADAWFEQDVQRAVLAVSDTINVPLTQNQFDALVAFTYNVGATAMAHSTLIKLLNQGRPAAGEFAKWNKVNGQPSAGLTRRRDAECKLFLAP